MLLDCIQVLSNVSFYALIHMPLKNNIDLHKAYKILLC